MVGNAWTYLETLWERSVNPGKAKPAADDSWNRAIEALYSLGIGLEKTLRYLYHEQPDLPAFKAWIESQSMMGTQDADSHAEDVLSADDLAFWEENGFVVIRSAIPRADCEATQRAIFGFLGAHADDKSSWYKAHEEQRGMMLTFTDHPCLNRNRRSPLIRKAYEQLYRSTALYNSIDKVSFNPPETKGFSFKGSGLHWDVSLRQPIAFVLQGLLYLSDCGPQDGAFHCVPGFHKTIGDWLGKLPPDEHPRDAAPRSLKPVAVAGNAGDFVIWHAALPHCATPNRGSSPRMVQYLTYFPNGYIAEPEWI